MAKMGETWFEQDGKLIQQKTVDYSDTLEKVKQARDLETFGSENKLVGMVPLELWNEWAKEAGIKLNDPAMSDVIARKLNDPNYAYLRVWRGQY